jgi:hypothetical protein
VLEDVRSMEGLGTGPPVKHLVRLLAKLERLTRIADERIVEPLDGKQQQLSCSGQRNCTPRNPKHTVPLLDIESGFPEGHEPATSRNLNELMHAGLTNRTLQPPAHSDGRTDGKSVFLAMLVKRVLGALY